MTTSLRSTEPGSRSPMYTRVRESSMTEPCQATPNDNFTSDISPEFNQEMACDYFTEVDFGTSFNQPGWRQPPPTL